MKKQYDFSKGQRGKFYRPGAKLSLPPLFQPGATVKFRLVNQLVRGKITEYRGPLAVGGKHLYRVEVPLYGNFFQAYELPEEELRPA